MDLVYIKRKILTKLLINNITRRNCQKFEATFANPQKVSHTLGSSCINVKQLLFTFIVQPILRGTIESLVREILWTGHGGFIVTREWTRQFLKHYMNESFHMANIVANKMLTNQHEKCQNMAYKITYLVRLYSIPLCLVVKIVTKLGSTLFQKLEKKHEKARAQNTFKCQGWRIRDK